jgi:hypothetical protein
VVINASFKTAQILVTLRQLATRNVFLRRNFGCMLPAEKLFVRLRYREMGYMAQPMPIPTSKNMNKDQIMYFTRSAGRLRLKNPKATEMSNAKSSIARK